jgi:tetratricopeptide (TPR) repeat protein
MGKTDEAVEILRKGIEYKRDEIDFYTLLSSIYESKEDYVKAQEALDEGLTIEGEDIDLIYRLGTLLDRKENKDEAIAQMRRVLELDPDNADAMNYIGYTYAEQNVNLDEALILIQKAINIKPDNGYYIDSLGWVYYRQGQYDLALTSLEKAFSLIEGGDPTIAEHLGDVYMKMITLRCPLRCIRRHSALSIRTRMQSTKR